MKEEFDLSKKIITKKEEIGAPMIYYADVKEFIQRLKEENPQKLYDNLVKSWSLDRDEIVEIICEYFNNKIEELAGKELTNHSPQTKPTRKNSCGRGSQELISENCNSKVDYPRRDKTVDSLRGGATNFNQTNSQDFKKGLKKGVEPGLDGLKPSHNFDKPIILDDNELSIMSYAEEFPKKWKKICDVLNKKKGAKN